MNTDDEQRAICRRYAVAWLPAPFELKLGVALNVRDGLVPLNGLRHRPDGDTTGWYLWAGEELKPDSDFFVPLHVGHLATWCPAALRFLGLPPGYRFLVAPDYEDIWYDPKLLEI